VIYETEKCEKKFTNYKFSNSVTVTFELGCLSRMLECILNGEEEKLDSKSSLYT